MAPVREWVRNHGGGFGVDNWHFIEGNSILLNDIIAYHLNPGQTVVRTLLNANLSLFCPGTVWDQFLPLNWFSSAFGICVSAQGQTDTHIPKMYDSYDEDPTIIGSELMNPVAPVIAPGDNGIYFNFALSQTIDTHGQRHFPASGPVPLIRVVLEVGTDNGLMTTGLGISWQATTYVRTLFEQSTS